MYSKLFDGQPKDCNKIVIWKHGTCAYEREALVPKGYLKPFGLFLKLVFDKGFRFEFNETFKYALRHAECYLGTGASDVLLYKNFHDDQNLWSEK